jgi:TRAP-type C4-dicarboxylate transport system permease small subunit
MGWFRDMAGVRLKRFLDLLMLIALDFVIFLCAILVLRVAISVTQYLFSEETLVISAAKVVSHAALICGYGLYTVFDLIGYVRKLRNEKE